MLILLLFLVGLVDINVTILGCPHFGLVDTEFTFFGCPRFGLADAGFTLFGFPFLDFLMQIFLPLFVLVLDLLLQSLLSLGPHRWCEEKKKKRIFLIVHSPKKVKAENVFLNYVVPVSWVHAITFCLTVGRWCDVYSSFACMPVYEYWLYSLLNCFGPRIVCTLKAGISPPDPPTPALSQLY